MVDEDDGLGSEVNLRKLELDKGGGDK